MSDKSKIEWTDATWNPIVGCSLVSPGCTNCYAMQQAARIVAMNEGAHKASVAQDPEWGAVAKSHYEGTTQPSKAGPVWTGKVALASEDTLTQPLRWKRPHRIFVNSMGDLFHESVPDAWIDRVFAVMALAPQHTFQVLTKRSARMRVYASDPETPRRVAQAAVAVADHAADAGIFKSRAAARSAGVKNMGHPHVAWPLPNVWLGVSAEDQPRADERMADLAQTPAAVHFVSGDPLLGPIDFTRFFWIGAEGGDEYSYTPRNFFQWVIVGGESGPNARPMHPDWARSIRDQCAAADVPFFFKQWGEFREFDVGPPPHIQVDDPSESADAYAAAAANPSWVAIDGQHFRRRDELPSDETPCRLIERVGKRRAGRLLDGVEHNACPEPRA